ncbi:MAG: ACT domain-containing protein [Candidatus Micrarchaeota archaeon]
MAKGTTGKLDERGRVIIPAPFREALGLKEGSNILLRHDEKNQMLVILPFAIDSDEIAKIELTMGDAPGTLARILAILASSNIDLIRSESTAQERGRSAEWVAIVDFSKCKKKPSELEKLLLKEKLARKVKIEKL